MSIDTSKHEEIYESFKRHYPNWADKVTNYYPKNDYAIRVILRDGDRVDYNIRSNSMRWVRDIDPDRKNDITDEECRQAFATNLVEFMHAQGFNQISLADKTGLSTAVISKYMRGKTTPTITALQKIARALNRAPEELLD